MLFLLAVSIVQAITVSGVEFTPDYSPGNVDEIDSGATITMNKVGKGSRLKGPKSFHGKFCAVPQSQMIPGTVLAMYASSGEPPEGVDRATVEWDELDFEFLLEDGVSDDGNIWVNTFHDGKALSGLYKSTGLASLKETTSKFCISWSIGPNPTSGETVNQAVWTIDGTVMNTQDLTGWKKPMFPYVSYWSSAGTEDAGLISWMGEFTPAVSVATLKDLEYVTLNAPAEHKPSPSPVPPPKTSAAPEEVPGMSTLAEVPEGTHMPEATSLPETATSLEKSLLPNSSSLPESSDVPSLKVTEMPPRKTPTTPKVPPVPSPEVTSLPPPARAPGIPYTPSPTVPYDCTLPDDDTPPYQPEDGTMPELPADNMSPDLLSSAASMQPLFASVFFAIAVYVL